MRALLTYRRARQSTCLVSTLQTMHTFTAQRGVGGDHRIHAGFNQRISNFDGFFITHVRGDLDRQRHTLTVLCSQIFLTLTQSFEQLLERQEDRSEEHTSELQ